MYIPSGSVLFDANHHHHHHHHIKLQNQRNEIMNQEFCPKQRRCPCCMSKQQRLDEQEKNEAAKAAFDAEREAKAVLLDENLHKQETLTPIHDEINEVDAQIKELEAQLAFGKQSPKCTKVLQK